MIDLYFSYRSPYSYLILPRMLKLKNEHNVQINFKIVYPLAIRMPEWFKNKNLCGITAGASTPDWIIEKIIGKISKFKV